MGNVVAGLYFGLKPFDSGFFSLFYQDKDKQQADFKISFSDVFYQRNMTEAVLESLRQCQNQLELPNPDGLIQLLKTVASVLNNKVFMHQLLTINQRIVILAENN